MNNRTEIIMSIKREWADKIFSGEKTIEVRKSVPRSKTAPGTNFSDTEINEYLHVLVYETKPNGGAGKIIGYFDVDEILIWEDGSDLSALVNNGGSCLTYDQLEEYSNGRTIYGYIISDYYRYHESDWYEIVNPPQSWRYV